MNEKVLIVDDEPNIVMALEYALKKKKYDVFIARDGDEAIEIVGKESPAMVLLDIMMPKVDGYEALQAIKKQKASTKVIFISAKNKPEDVEKGLDMGADAYFTKPFSIKKLITEVEHLLKQ